MHMSRFNTSYTMKFIKYLPQAESISKLSKGRNTKVGCKVMALDCSVLSEGYNGAPRGSSADEHNDVRNVKPEKYYWFAHAESNAVAQAAKHGMALNNSIMVVTHMPCTSCAKSIIQAGIKHVFTYEPIGKYLDSWYEELSRTIRLFRECGVELYVVNKGTRRLITDYKLPLIDIIDYRDFKDTIL